MTNAYNILEPFRTDQEALLTLKDFEQHFNTPHQTIKRHLQPLVEQHIIITQRKGNTLLHTLNTKNPVTKEHLVIAEKEALLQRLREDPLIRIIYEKIHETLTKEIAILFGTATKKGAYNDIDLLILPPNKDLEQQLLIIERTYHKKIHQLHTHEDTLTKTLKEEIRKKHIILHNTEQAMRIMS